MTLGTAAVGVFYIDKAVRLGRTFTAQIDIGNIEQRFTEVNGAM